MKNKSILDYWGKGRKSHKPSPSSLPLSQINEHSGEHPSQTETQERQEVNQNEQHETEHLITTTQVESHFETSQEDQDDYDLLPHDPGKRKPILSYPINDQDAIRRGFIEKKPCRPKPKTDFPQTLQGNKLRRFKLHCQTKAIYKARLTYSLQCLRCLLKQGLAFRGHNESETSNNKGNFHELLEWIAGRCENVAKIVLTDESSDESHKEQLAICLRYVDKKGNVSERFLGIVKVDDTTSMTLMTTIKKLLDDYSLSMSNIRGQGYDGESNMRGELNGLKNLIMRNNPYAYYVHSFAHQLQLTLVAVAKKNRMKMVRTVQARNVLEALELGEIESGRGLNQELYLSRPGDTQWGSHFKSIVNLIGMYPTIIEFLEKIGSSSKCVDDRAKAQIAIDHLESFEFIFIRDQDIVNAMTIVDLTKDHLQIMRDDGWNNFLDTACNFCVKHKVEVPNMSDFYAPPGRSRRFLDKVINLHRYRVEIRFDETSKELLLCMACLSPDNVFASFDKLKLMRLAEFYPKEFTSVETNLGELSVMLVETKKHRAYSSVYLLLKLVLILPVTTTSVERVFSSMKFVKNKLRNRLGDELLNHCLVTFVERDYFVKVSDDDIINRFQNMKSRRMVLD
ncbi:hypothetical protein RND81_13G056700 [Saponaria officinalis]|uniref:Zinc finger MYM-type protein 1-like n=1 Tax=Saponaria officinalis TaxID=3572 RepID=A0AAW1GXF4_SAPOF